MLQGSQLLGGRQQAGFPRVAALEGVYGLHTLDAAIRTTQRRDGHEIVRHQALHGHALLHVLRTRLPVLGSVLGNALLCIVHGNHPAAVLHLLVILLLLLLLLLLLGMPLWLLGLLVTQTAGHVLGTGLGVCVSGCGCLWLHVWRHVAGADNASWQVLWQEVRPGRDHLHAIASPLLDQGVGTALRPRHQIWCHCTLLLVCALLLLLVALLLVLPCGMLLSRRLLECRLPERRLALSLLGRMLLGFGVCHLPGHLLLMMQLLLLEGLLLGCCNRPIAARKVLALGCWAPIPRGPLFLRRCHGDDSARRVHADMR